MFDVKPNTEILKQRRKSGEIGLLIQKSPISTKEKKWKAKAVEWKTTSVNVQNIKVETEKAVLIQCPHNSRYDGYCFWHPAKLCRAGKNSYAISLSYTDAFTFILKKYGNGKYNKFDIICEQEIGVPEFEEMFGVMDENISCRKHKNQYETHKPDYIEAVTVSVPNDLKDG